MPASAGTGRPAGERGGNPGTAPQRRLPPGRRCSRPGAFTTPSRRERGFLRRLPGEGDAKAQGSLWIPDCFGVRRQSGAVPSSLGDGGYRRVCREPGHRVHYALRRRRFPLAATPLSWMRCRIQSGGRPVCHGQPRSQVRHRRFRRGFRYACRRTPKRPVAPLHDRQQSGTHKEPSPNPDRNRNRDRKSDSDPDIDFELPKHCNGWLGAGGRALPAKSEKTGS